MKQINLLPEPTFAEQYKRLFSIGATLLLVSISIYWLLPHLHQIEYSPISPTPSTYPEGEVQFAKHSVYKLQMVGYLNQKTHTSDAPWSVIQTPDGQVTTIKIGDYVGYEGAKVTDIKPAGIYLNVPDKTKPVFIRATLSIRE